MEMFFRCARGVERRGHVENDHDSRRGTFCDAGDQPSSRALFVSRWADRFPCETFCRSELEVVDDSEETIATVQRGCCGWTKIATINRKRRSTTESQRHRENEWVIVFGGSSRHQPVIYFVSGLPTENENTGDACGTSGISTLNAKLP